VTKGGVACGGGTEGAVCVRGCDRSCDMFAGPDRATPPQLEIDSARTEIVIVRQRGLSGRSAFIIWSSTRRSRPGSSDSDLVLLILRESECCRKGIPCRDELILGGSRGGVGGLCGLPARIVGRCLAHAAGLDEITCPGCVGVVRLKRGLPGGCQAGDELG